MHLDLLSIPQSGGKMSKRLVGGIIGRKYKTSVMAFKWVPRWYLVTLRQQFSIGEKPTVMVYTYISRHEGTPDKTKQKNCST